MQTALLDKVARGETPTPEEAARAVWQLIVDEPRRHRQSHWYGLHGDSGSITIEEARSAIDDDCGTTACVAGWAVILTAPEGAVLRGGAWVDLPGNSYQNISVVAQQTLGLTDKAAAWLFASERVRDEVLAALEHIANGGKRTRKALRAAAGADD